MSIAGMEFDDQWLTVSWTDGSKRRYPALWLRDNVPSGRHRPEGQRTFDINAVPRPSLRAVRRRDDAIEVEFAPEGLTERFSGAWLAAFSEAPPVEPRSLWDGSIQARLEYFDYERVRSDDRLLLRWLEGVCRLGFGLLRNVPVVPGTVASVVDLFGFLRETNYGRLFDVIVEPDPANLANTNAAIGMHTDNPYRDPVPGLQLLHCLVNQTDGGESRLCDGFAVAGRLRREDPDAFELLSSRAVSFRYLDAGATDLRSSRPVIEVGPQGEVVGVRFNSRSVGPFEMPADDLPAYYGAYLAFGSMLNDPAAAIELVLEPGHLMIFDNQRVLHSRGGYGSGRRHLQGCYADKDGLYSTIRVLGG